MNKLPIVAFAPHPWKESEWMNRQQLLSRMGKRGWPVIYSQGAMDIWQRNTDQWNMAGWLGDVEQSDYVSLYHSGRNIPRWRKNPIFDQFAIAYHAQCLKKAVGIKRNDRNFITLAFNPVFWPYVKALNSRYVAFHIYDLFSKMHAWSDEQEAMYQALLERADLITASSEAMIEDMPDRYMDKVKILHNGVDIDLFDNSIEHACPADLTAIPRPRIANIGAINRKIDLTLVAEIAETRPEWHWVFIGKVIKQQLYEDIEATAAFEKCESLPNVHFLGEKNRLAIPAYAQHSDINVICYRIKEGEWVSAGYPLKLNEYLAVGKPVIASPMQAIKSHFSNYVSIASTKEEWIKAIELAQLQGGVGTPEQRKKIAGQNSWDNRVDSLEKWFLEEFS